MADLEVQGAEKLALLGKAVRKLGADRIVLKHLNQRIRAGFKDTRQELKASAKSTLPRRGGLGKWVASASVRVAIRRGANTAGVQVVMGRNSAGKRTDMRAIERGKVRHPTWGHKPWTPQTVPAGFAARVFEGPTAAEFHGLVVASIDDAVAEVLRGL